MAYAKFKDDAGGRWKILDKACLAVDPTCKIPVPKIARERVERRLDALTEEAFMAELWETTNFLARMRDKYLAMQAAFYAEMAAHQNPAYQRDCMNHQNQRTRAHLASPDQHGRPVDRRDEALAWVTYDLASPEVRHAA